MFLFVIFYERGMDDELERRLRASFPDHFPLLPGQLYVVRSPNVEKPDTVAKALGLFEPDAEGERSSGVVLKLNGSVTGFYRPAFWDLVSGREAVRHDGP